MQKEYNLRSQARISETSVNLHQTTRLNNPETSLLKNVGSNNKKAFIMPQYVKWVSLETITYETKRSQ